jgi:hypothetical protein
VAMNNKTTEVSIMSTDRLELRPNQPVEVAGEQFFKPQ